MVDLNKEIGQCYLTDPTTDVENRLWFIHEEFPFLHDWLLEPSIVHKPLVEVYVEYADSERLVFTRDIEAWIGEGREAEFGAYFDAVGRCDVYDYDTYLNCAIGAHRYNVEETLVASHKQVVLYAALLYIVKQRQVMTMSEGEYEKLREVLMEAADEFRDEHTMEGIQRYVDELIEHKEEV